jgi:hypothetical protein
VLEVMVFAAFGSSCHACIDTEGRRACPRCSGGVKHPAAANFYNMVDVLLAHGLKLSSKLKRAVEEVRVYERVGDRDAGEAGGFRGLWRGYMSMSMSIGGI